jgi:hypothetical protein
MSDRATFTLDFSRVESIATLCYLQYKWLLVAMQQKRAALTFGRNSYDPTLAKNKEKEKEKEKDGQLVVSIYTPPHLAGLPNNGAAVPDKFSLDINYITKITEAVCHVQHRRASSSIVARGREGGGARRRRYFYFLLSIE